MFNQKGAIPILGLIVIGLVVIGIAKVVTTPSINNQATPNSQSISQNVSSGDVKQRQLDLTKYITVEAALLNATNNVSLYFRDLGSNEEVAIDPTRSWIPASTIKSYVVLEAFRQRSLGLVDFNKTVTITASNVVATELETDEFPRLREGTQATIKQLVEAMIIQSDNTAYNSLLDILGRKNITSTLQSLGLTETVVGEKLNLDDSQFSQDLQVAGRQPNTTTVKDLGAFFDLLYSKKVANSDEILAIFERQKINNMIPALLPQNTIVAHKTGDWAPIYNDGGVVFKPASPFVLAVFTNANDPSVVSKMARVAYFQNPDSVGKNLSFNSNNSQSGTNISLITLKSMPLQAILGEQTPKNPTVSAADLGIKSTDLSISNQQINNLRGAFVNPGSPFYKIKQVIDDARLRGAANNTVKAETYVSLARERLAEVKAEYSGGNLSSANSLLKESESDLEKATNLAQSDPNKDLLLVEIKQTNDLHYGVLLDQASKLPTADKAQFVDDVYNFYQQNHKVVQPAINTSITANLGNQQPAIGTVTTISGDKATLKFDDGVEKQLILTDNVKVRSFGQNDYQGKDAVSSGDKVAVIGLTNSYQQIIPEFIMKDVPNDLPSKHTGTVIEINPDKNTLKILNEKGQEEILKVNENTNIQSTDTNVSLLGIKAGSEVTFTGVNAGSIVSSSNQIDLNVIPVIGGVLNSLNQGFTQHLSSSSGSLETPKPSSTSGPISASGSAQSSSLDKVITSSGSASSSTTGQSSAAPMQINATTITVVTNSSGSNEKVQIKPASSPSPSAAPKSGPTIAPKATTTPATPKPATSTTGTTKTATPTPTQAPIKR